MNTIKVRAPGTEKGEQGQARDAMIAPCSNALTMVALHRPLHAPAVLRGVPAAVGRLGRDEPAKCCLHGPLGVFGAATGPGRRETAVAHPIGVGGRHRPPRHGGGLCMLTIWIHATRDRLSRFGGGGRRLEEWHVIVGRRRGRDRRHGERHERRWRLDNLRILSSRWCCRRCIASVAGHLRGIGDERAVERLLGKGHHHRHPAVIPLPPRCRRPATHERADDREHCVQRHRQSDALLEGPRLQPPRPHDDGHADRRHDSHHSPGDCSGAHR